MDVKAARPRAAFHLGLLGGFDLTGPDRLPISLPTRKCELMLAYLAMPAGQFHSRDKLASLFWGDRQDEQAQGSLRKALSALRAALGADALLTERDAIALVPAAISVDADELASVAADPGGMAAGDLRFGELLDGKSPTSPEFSDWLTFERVRCRNHALVVLAASAEMYASEKKYAEAMASAHRLLSLDPLREESHRLLMRLLAKSGERSKAMAQFIACRDLLRKELGVEPSAETLKLSRSIGASDEATVVLAAEPKAERSTGQRQNLSVAVLPFANKSGEPEQDIYAEGLSEDIITELSRQKDLLVIARQSSFQFTPDASRAAAAAGELGVRYALTGSFRRAGDRVRVTAQLIDAAGDRCIWAERYDRKIEDLFAVQDEVVAQIIASTDAQLRLAERERAARKRPESLDAWEAFHRGMWYMYRFAREDVASAEQFFRKARDLDHGFSMPLAGLAYACFVSVTWHFTDNVKTTVGAGIGYAEAAVTLDENDAFSRVVLGRLCTLSGDVPQALRHLAAALQLNPSYAQAHFGMAQALFWAGEPADALEHVDAALRLNPKDPLASMFMTMRSFCYYWLGDFEAAEVAARDATALEARETWSYLALACALEARGNLSEAGGVIAKARQINPRLTIASFNAVVGHTPPDLKQRVYAGLRAAGLSEG